MMSVTVESEHDQQAPQASNGRSLRGDDPADHDLLPLPSHLAGDQCRIVAEIAILDDRSLRAFGATSSARHQVKELLRNSLRSDLECNETRFLNRAAQAFRDRILSRNRTRYVFGVLLGLVPVAVLAWLASTFNKDAIHNLGMETALCCSWTILFAGMGTLCSVFTRLSTIDMCDETNALFVYLSGVFRPLTATMFAITIIQILRLNALSVSAAPPGPGAPDALHIHLYFLVAFLSGFSERFASDLIGRAERAVGAAAVSTPGGGGDRQMSAPQPGRPAGPA